MINEIAATMSTEVAARLCPLPVVYGPERIQDANLSRSRIVVERPRTGGETIGPPRVPRHNPPRRAERGIPGVVRIFARSNVDGARPEDHEVMVDAAADVAICALQVAVTRLKTTATITSAGLVDPATLELPELRSWSGAVYEIAFVAQHGVHDVTWAGDAKATQGTWSIATSGTCTSTAAPDP